MANVTVQLSGPNGATTSFTFNDVNGDGTIDGGERNAFRGAARDAIAAIPGTTGGNLEGWTARFGSYNGSVGSVSNGTVFSAAPAGTANPDVSVGDTVTINGTEYTVVAGVPTASNQISLADARAGRAPTAAPADPPPAEDPPADPPATPRRRTARPPANPDAAPPANPPATTGDTTAWTGRAMRIRVNGGEWHVLTNGQDGNTDTNSAEAARLIGLLGDSPGDMNHNVEIQYGPESGGTTRFNSTDRMTLGALYDSAGTPRPGTRDTMGTATIRYRESARGRIRTETVQYELSPDSSGRVTNDEATRIRDRVDARQREAQRNGGHYIVEDVVAEGETFTSMGSLGDRAAMSDDAFNADDTDENSLANDMAVGNQTESMEASFNRMRQTSRQQRARIRMILANMLNGGTLNWRQVLSYFNMSTMSANQLRTEAAAYAVKAMHGLEQEQSRVTDQMGALDSDDRGYASRLQQLNTEMSGINGRRSAIMNFLRSNDEVYNEYKNLSKSLYDGTLSKEERGMVFQ